MRSPILFQICSQLKQQRLGNATLQIHRFNAFEKVERKTADIEPIFCAPPITYVELAETSLDRRSRLVEAGEHSFLQSCRSATPFVSSWIGPMFISSQCVYISGSPTLPAGGRWRR